MVRVLTANQVIFGHAGSTPVPSDMNDAEGCPSLAYGDCLENNCTTVPRVQILHPPPIYEGRYPSGSKEADCKSVGVCLRRFESFPAQI